MKSKPYNYCIRKSKIVFEALLRLKLECFEKWLEREGKNNALYNLRVSYDFSKLMKDRNYKTSENGLKVVNALAQLYEKFNDSIHKGNYGKAK